MAESLDQKLDRWVSAGVLDPESAARIRNFEGPESGASGTRWAVWIAVALGAIALGAGVFLFVASHWDDLSPGFRLALVVAMVAGFHGIAIAVRHSEIFAMALHALGTLSLGAAIALVGQIFHMEEHWSGGAMLWAIGAAAGWWFRRDWPQLTLLSLLAPAWVIAEWTKWHSNRNWSYLVLFILLLAIGYIASRLIPLRWIGAITVLPAFFILAFDSKRSRAEDWMGYALVACALIAGLLLARGEWLPLLGAAAWAIGVRYLAAQEWKVAWHAWGALGWVAMVAWGVWRSRAERINLGIVGFAATVLSFYFANVMDKLGRSLSLIALGILFLGGGWVLERLRRRLIAEIES